MGLRDYETRLKNKFLDWLINEPKKIEKIFSLLDANVCLEFEKRSKPFHMVFFFDLVFNNQNLVSSSFA